MIAARALPLSLFYKILVLVEDNDEVSLDQLYDLGSKRQVLGSLGRLEGLNYVTRHAAKLRQDDTISLTDKGEAVLDSLLEYMPTTAPKWDGKWRMIIFDIPESKRTTRQMFRLKLIDLGARMFQSSVWITPSSKLVEKFSQVVTEHGYNGSVHYFEADPVAPSHIDIASLWQLDELSKEYQDLLKVVKQSISQLKRDPEASYKAKCLIVAMALISKKDPQLPAELMPAKWAGKEVHEWHTQLRQLCEL